MPNEIWKNIEETQKTNQEDDMLYVKKISADAHALFEDNSGGKKFLEFLEAYYIKEIPVADPASDSQHAFWREGQNSIIRQLRGWVNTHKLYMQGDIK